MSSRHSTLLDINKAIENARKFHGAISNEYTRYRSWEHCYKAFQEYRHLKDKPELLCLHLAQYLASWGMLRNSFLLNKDYFVHMPVVKVLTSGRYEQLFIEPHTPNTIALVMQASNEIQNAYDNRATETLITKVLLGVLGCAPAYDEYFKIAVRKYKVCAGTWGLNSLNALWDYYQTHREMFEKLQQELTLEGLIYPPMKLMDMCLWQIGSDEAPKKKPRVR